jgi:hypothetical protein
MAALETIWNYAGDLSHHPRSLPQDRMHAMHAGSSEPMRIPSSRSWTARALAIPEVVLLIQERLDRASLCTSLRLSRLWHSTGHHLVWKSVEWTNAKELGIDHEMILLQNSHRIRTLKCVFHSLAGPCSIDSSSLLRSILDGDGKQEKDGRVGYSTSSTPIANPPPPPPHGCFS